MSRKLFNLGLLGAILLLPSAVLAQFAFTTNNGVITITSYTGAGSIVVIPDTINGYPVTSIGQYAFHTIGGQSVKNVTIPVGITSIGDEAFSSCGNLTNVTIASGLTNVGSQTFSFCSHLKTIMVDPMNLFYGSINGVLFDKSQTTLIQCPGGTVGNYTVPGSITNIGIYAFGGCSNLKGVYFQSDAPSIDSTAFHNANSVTVYYLSGTVGWSSTFAGRPAVLWNPNAQNDSSFGIQTNQFGFNIVGSSNLVVVVEACTDFANPVWSPVSTNTLNTFMDTNGTSYFTDPQWTNYPARFYRLRSP